MKFLILIIFALMFVITAAFATPLENTELNGRSGVIALDIEFGPDKINYGLFRTTVTTQLDNIRLLFYGDEITLSEPELKVGDTSFRISSIPEGIIMYGHKNTDTNNYDINLYFTTDKGFLKFPVTTNFSFPEDKVAKVEPVKEKQYVPELRVTSTNDFRTYWNDNFNFDVQTFDGRINKDPKPWEFEGRLDGVDITAIISLGGETIATFKGITENGNWDGEHYIQAPTAPGEYSVDILASYGNQTVSTTSSMFVIAFYATGSIGGGNKAPIADAGVGGTITEPDTFDLDGTASSDPDGDTLTFSWVIQSGLGSLSNETTATPTYTSAGATTAVIELTVVDPKGKSNTDTVIITVDP